MIAMTNPFRIDGPACISLSGGRSSGYLLYQVLQAHGGKLPPDAKVAFANTGKEDWLTLAFVQDISRNWDVPVTWLEYRDHPSGFLEVNFDTASRYGEPFDALIAKKKFLPNAVMRFCTSELKIKPINAWFRNQGYGEFDMLVGIRADEPARIAKMPHLHKPLAMTGVTKQFVKDWWKKQPFDLRAEDGNCDLCFNKGISQLMSSIRKRPEKAVWWARAEERVGATFAKNRPSYAQMRQNALDQADMWGYEDEIIGCFCGD